VFIVCLKRFEYRNPLHREKIDEYVLHWIHCVEYAVV
jgi:hypothetical protein